MSRSLSSSKRELFLASALQLFVRNGVQHTSTADIAKDAGTAAGTLFLYFPTKQDLINALVLKITQDQSAFIHARLDPSLSAQEMFHVIWSGSIHWLLDHREAYQYVRQVRDSGIIPTELVQETAGYFDYYYTAIQKGVEESAIKPYPIDLIGGFLYQEMVAVLNVLEMQRDATDPDVIIEQGFEIFWNGICQLKELK